MIVVISEQTGLNALTLKVTNKRLEIERDFVFLSSEFWDGESIKYGTLFLNGEPQINPDVTKINCG